MRLELPRNGWAELRERLTYGQARDLRVAFLKAKSDEAVAADLPLFLMRAYVSSWQVTDFDGHAVSLEDPEQAPDDVLIEISAACIDLWNGSSDLPKAGNGASVNMLQALPSESATPSSPMSSSSEDTPAGVGPI